MALVNGVKLMDGRREIEIKSSRLRVHLYVSIGRYREECGLASENPTFAVMCGRRW